MTEAAALSPDAEGARWKAMAVLFAGAAVIGFGPVFVRFAEAGPAAAAFWRLTLALPLLALMARRSGEGVGPPNPIAMWAGVAFALDLAFWHYGIAFTSVGKATILSNLTPVLVTAVTWLVFRQRPARLFLAAVAMAVAGASIMTLTKGAGSVGKAPLLGDVLSVATAFWYSLYFLAVSHARTMHSTTRLMFWATLTGAPLLLLAALGLGEQILPVTPLGWAAVGGLGVMHVAGQGSIAWALGRLPTATASVVVLIQPVVATALGAWLFHELFGPWQAVGAAVALAGVVLAQWSSRPQSKA